MNFDLDEDQQTLHEVLRDLLSQQADSASLRAALDGPAGWDEGLWKSLAESLGVLGLILPERLGGAGAGLVELAIVQEALGERLAMVPYLAVTLGAEALLACATEEQQQAWLPQVPTGVLRPVLAVAEGRRPWLVAGTSVRADTDGAAGTVTGRKDHVLATETATGFLVPAATADGVRLFWVEAEAAGVTRTADESLDPARPTGSVVFDSAPAVLVGDGSVPVPEALDRVHLVGSLLLAAEQVGGMQRCVDVATEHARTRVQFDRPIGGFQAVKHRCADMYVDLVSAQAVTRYAAWALQAQQPGAERDVRLAQAVAGEAYYRVARSSIQVHGGIGCTWEHDAHLYLKRAVTSRQLLGDVADTRARAAEQLQL